MAALGWFLAGMMLGGFVGTLLVSMLVISDVTMLRDKIMDLRNQLDDCKNREVFGELYNAGKDE